MDRFERDLERAASGSDPEAAVALGRARLRRGALVLSRLSAAADAGCTWSAAVLVQAPGVAPGHRWDLRALRSWLSAFAKHGLPACLQVATAASTVWPPGPSCPRIELISELRSWCECPCLDHRRGVEHALAACRVHLSPWDPARWAGSALARDLEAPPWETLWRRSPVVGTLPRRLLVRRIRAQLSAWAAQAPKPEAPARATPPTSLRPR